MPAARTSSSAAVKVDDGEVPNDGDGAPVVDDAASDGQRTQPVWATDAASTAATVTWGSSDSSSDVADDCTSADTAAGKACSSATMHSLASAGGSDDDEEATPNPSNTTWSMRKRDVRVLLTPESSPSSSPAVSTRTMPSASL
jgi:hypothetical protein